MVMKAKIYIFLLLLGFANSLYGEKNWVFLNGIENDYGRKIVALSNDTVFIVGSNRGINVQGMIAKSTDGGITWTKTYPTDGLILTDVVFINKTIGLAVGQAGTILKTTDGGSTWTAKTSGTSKNLNAIALTIQNHLWTVGDEGIVLRSIDTGESWQVINIAETARSLNDITFNVDTAYIAGSNRTLYRTEDAGNTWIQEIIETENYYNEALISVAFVRNFVFTVNSDEYIRDVYKKTKNGWSVSTGIGQINPLVFVNDSVGYSLFTGILTNGGGNVMAIHKFKTTDAGEQELDVHTYSSWTNRVDTRYSDICFPSDSVGYAISGNILLKTAPKTLSGMKKPLIKEQTIVYSNKTNNLTIESEKSIEAIDVIDTSGMTVLSRNKNNPIFRTIDVSPLQQGVYLVKICFSDKSISVNKWIKH